MRNIGEWVVVGLLLVAVGVATLTIVKATREPVLRIPPVKTTVLWVLQEP